MKQEQEHKRNAKDYCGQIVCQPSSEALNRQALLLSLDRNVLKIPQQHRTTRPNRRARTELNGHMCLRVLVHLTASLLPVRSAPARAARHLIGDTRLRLCGSPLPTCDAEDDKGEGIVDLLLTRAPEEDEADGGVDSEHDEGLSSQLHRSGCLE